MSASGSHSAVVLGLAEEFLERYRQGERPSLKEYIDRHPDLAAEIKEVFPAMALMENVALADKSLDGGVTGPAPATEAAPPRQLGDYRILREVGRGGMGIVYEAEQISLGRHVALKVLSRKLFVDDQQRRFEREARAAARLHHTNIVPVFGVGEHEGLPYYVMQFIQGLGLDEVLRELRRMHSRGGPSETSGELRVECKDISAADAALSLMTGAFADGERGGVSAPRETLGARTQPQSPGSSATGKLSGSLTLSPSSVVLPGSSVVTQGKSKKASYWQSVARIGVQVAIALEYAHKQGIQHRDIKPSNLLLDTRGTVWVTDFGLARADSEDHLTQTGDIIGTLRYMPPEAFEGRADKRSDIYSLGLTLYELLALQPAFAEKDRHKLIKRVTTEEPARLDRLSRAIPRDLVTIVHKAIDREPSRRYATAGELAADLQRFLDDEPIQARRISSVERFTRWSRHHPGVVTLTGALFGLLLAVTVLSLLAAARFDRLAHEQAAAAENERQARREAEEAKEHEAALRQQAEEAQQQAEGNLREAERQKQRADANFDKARQAVDGYFTTVSESQLLQVPGAQPLRRDLLQSALVFYQDFLKERGDDPTIRGELAAAYLRVGKIRTEMGEDAEASKAYEKARELYDSLTQTAPDKSEWRHGLAQCYYRLGRTEDAIVLWEKLVQPGHPGFQKELAMAYNLRGNSHANAGRFAESLQAHQQALAIREMLVRLNPEDGDAQRDLGITLNNIGTLLGEKERHADALVMYRRAVDHVEAAFFRAPQVIGNGQLVIIGLSNVANVERKLGHANEALAAYRRAVEAAAKLARNNPAVPGLQRILFQRYLTLALYQRERKQTQEYERSQRLAHEVIDRLPGDGPESLFNLACMRAEYATFFFSGKEKLSAAERAEREQEVDLAVKTLGKAITAGFRDRERLRWETVFQPLRVREDFKAVEAMLAAPEAGPDKLKAGLQTLALREKLAQADPGNKRLRADLAASQHAIALIQLDLGNPAQARTHLDQALALWEELVHDEPKNTEYQADRAMSRFALGDFSWQAGRLAEAARLWQGELEKLEAAERQGIDRLIASGRLLAMRRTIAQHYGRAGLWNEAAFHYGQLILLEGATQQDYFNAACLSLRAGDSSGYRRVCAEMVKSLEGAEDLEQCCLLAWACGLADNSGIDAAQLLKWAKQRTGKNPPIDYWWDQVLGVAHYRAGHFSEALALASKSDARDLTRSERILNWPVVALAHHRLGHAAEAQQWLEKATQEWRRLSPLPRTASSTTVLPDTSGHWHEKWHDWPTYEVLLREASLLITGKPPIEEAYDQAHRGFLYSRLGASEKAEPLWQDAVKTLPREPILWLLRAYQLVEGKRLKEMETALAKSEEFASDRADVWKERGRLYFLLGQTDKASANFRKALELLGDSSLPNEPIRSETDKLFSQLALAAFIERNPEDLARRRKRGEWYVRHWRWQEAANDFRLLVERQPPQEAERWLNVAPVLAAGDLERYRGLCREMKNRFGDTQDPTTAERIAKSSLLLPELTGEVKWACTLADRAVARGQNHAYFHYFRFCKALADYRREDYRAVVEGLASLHSLVAYAPTLACHCHLVLAMALSRQGDAKAAHQHLARGAELLHQYLPEPNSSSPVASQYSHDWVIAWLLHREAQTLIEGNKARSKK